MSTERFVLAVGDSVNEVLGRDDVELVELRPTFVLLKATNVIAAEIQRQCGRFITLLDGERAATAAIELFDHVPSRNRRLEPVGSPRFESKSRHPRPRGCVAQLRT